MHPTDGVQPSIDREMESVMEGGVVGIAELGIGEPGVENLTIDVDGGQAPSPGSAVGRGGLRSRRLRHALSLTSSADKTVRRNGTKKAV